MSSCLPHSNLDVLRPPSFLSFFQTRNELEKEIENKKLYDPDIEKESKSTKAIIPIKVERTVDIESSQSSKEEIVDEEIEECEETKPEEYEEEIWDDNEEFYFETFSFENEEQENDYEEVDFYFDMEELWEKRLYNSKKMNKVQRSKKKNKKEKISKKFVKWTVYNKKEERKTHFVYPQIEATKENSKRRIAIHNTTNEDSILNRALYLSRKEYNKNMKNGANTVLSLRQINELQTRELTPEDYELLLLLDSTVKPKTIKKNVVKEFPQIEVTDKWLREESESGTSNKCSVCLSDFELGETLKVLPCSHFFHSNCIDHWLLHSSIRCPVDNLPVDDS